MSESSDQSPPEPKRIRETIAAEAFDNTITRKRHARSIRFLLGLLPADPIPDDAKARIEQIMTHWQENHVQVQTVLEDQLRQLLNLGPNDMLTDEMIPSAEKVRRQIDEQIPYQNKFSDLVIAMREE
jgi:hypothetical protein